MRKIFIDDLPKRGKQQRYVDWEKSIGCKVHFICDEIEGDIIIVGFDKLKKRNNDTV